MTFHHSKSKKLLVVLHFSSRKISPTLKSVLQIAPCHFPICASYGLKYARWFLCLLAPVVFVPIKRWSHNLLFAFHSPQLPITYSLTCRLFNVPANKKNTWINDERTWRSPLLLTLIFHSMHYVYVPLPAEEQTAVHLVRKQFVYSVTHQNIRTTNTSSLSVWIRTTVCSRLIANLKKIT